jgi:hypothetical protein
MNIVLLLDILWIIVVSGSFYWNRARISDIPFGPFGGAIGWLLMVILGILLIHLLVPGVAPYRPL